MQLCLGLLSMHERRQMFGFLLFHDTQFSCHYSSRWIRIHGCQAQKIHFTGFTDLMIRMWVCSVQISNRVLNKIAMHWQILRYCFLDKLVEETQTIEAIWYETEYFKMCACSILGLLFVNIVAELTSVFNLLLSYRSFYDWVLIRELRIKLQSLSWSPHPWS